jgi:hypothetical protein
MRVSGSASRFVAAATAWEPDLTSAERRRAFLARLARMSSQERVRAARFEFDREQRSTWAGHYPEEAPTVDGEVEWIGLALADLD